MRVVPLAIVWGGCGNGVKDFLLIEAEVLVKVSAKIHFPKKISS